MNIRVTTFIVSILAIAAVGCAQQSSRFEQNKMELRSLRLEDASTSLMICEIFPDATRHSLDFSTASELREILLRAEASSRGLLDNFNGTISPPVSLSWIEFDELRWYFVPPGETHGFELRDDDSSRFEELVKQISSSQSTKANRVARGF